MFPSFLILVHSVLETPPLSPSRFVFHSDRFLCEVSNKDCSGRPRSCYYGQVLGDPGAKVPRSTEVHGIAVQATTSNHWSAPRLKMYADYSATGCDSDHHRLIAGVSSYPPPKCTAGKLGQQS